MLKAFDKIESSHKPDFFSEKTYFPSWVRNMTWVTILYQCHASDDWSEWCLLFIKYNIHMYSYCMVKKSCPIFIVFQNIQTDKTSWTYSIMIYFQATLQGVTRQLKVWSRHSRSLIVFFHFFIFFVWYTRIKSQERLNASMYFFLLNVKK